MEAFGMKIVKFCESVCCCCIGKVVCVSKTIHLFLLMQGEEERVFSWPICTAVFLVFLWENKKKTLTFSVFDGFHFKFDVSA